MSLLKRGWAGFLCAMAAAGALSAVGCSAAPTGGGEAVAGHKDALIFLAPTPPDPAVGAAVAAANGQARDGLALRGVTGFNYSIEDNDGPSYVDDALDAVLGLQDYGQYEWYERGSLTEGEFEQELGAPFTAVLPSVDAWLGQPGEPVQIGYLRTTLESAPSAPTWKTLYVVIYYESMNVAVIDKDIYEV